MEFGWDTHPKLTAVVLLCQWDRNRLGISLKVGNHIGNDPAYTGKRSFGLIRQPAQGRKFNA